MVIVMEDHASEAEIQNIMDRLKSLGYGVHRSDGVQRTLLGVVGETRGQIDRRDLELFQGVREVVPISKPYKLVSREFHPDDTVIKINKLEIGGEKIVVMAGPCAVESREQIKEIALEVCKSGASVLRGGAFKPRTSPYSFQGLGEEGLKYMREAADLCGLAVISEVMDVSQIGLVSLYADILQVGARNMQNFWLLKELGKIRKPVMLKRGMSATIEEWLMAAEYIMAGGNYSVMLCERGIRTFENYTRNTLDLSAIPVIQKLSHLPVIVDPSHGTGRRDKVPAMARAAVAAGANGLIIEVHTNPEKALSDGAQSLYPDQFKELVKELKIIADVVYKNINHGV